MLLPKIGDLVRLGSGFDFAIVLVVDDKPKLGEYEKTEHDLFRGYILGSEELKLFSKVHIKYILSGVE